MTDENIPMTSTETREQNEIEFQPLITTTGGLTAESAASLIPDAEDDTQDDRWVEVEPTGYQLCEFCESSGEPHNVSDTLCDCRPIERSVASRAVHPHAELAMRIAESAVLNLWGRQGTTASNPVVISDSHINGAIDGDRIVTLTFEGMLIWSLGETYTTEYGSAEIYSFSGDGEVRVKVPLDDELTERRNNNELSADELLPDS